MDENNQTVENEEQDSNKVGRIALRLFTFLQRCRMNAKAEPTPAGISSFDFSVADITDEGVPFGLSFQLTHMDVKDVEDNPASIEQYCVQYVLNVGNSMLVEKLTRLLEYSAPAQKSKIILP